MAVLQKSGCHLRSGIRFLRWGVGILMALSLSLHAETLQQIQDLADAGAPALALDLLQQQQPALTDNTDGWMVWERSRVHIYAASSDWQAMATRLQQLPSDLPENFSRWAVTWRARALIEIHQPEQARVLLRQLLWSNEGGDSDIIAWRRLVIRSYRSEGRGADAYAAMQRYRQDYGKGGRDDAVLGAQVLLGQGRAADAVDVLAGADDPEARSLLLLAQLRSVQLAPRKVLRQARVALRDKTLTLPLRQQYQAIVAIAAKAADDPAAEAIALETLFSNARRTPYDKTLFPLTPDDLWNAYVAYAKRVGNREQLLIGDDAAWNKAAAAAGRMYPIRAHSFYALLALEGLDEKTRLEAHSALVEQLLQADDGAELVRQLYLAAPRYKDIYDVPENVRRVLLDPVIASGDLALASKLLAGLNEPTAGADRTMWRLRQAKVFVLAGDHKRAAEVLGGLVQTASQLARPEVDRLIQVLFDLQTVGENDVAYELFAALEKEVSDPQVQRELWYWMGDSRLAQKRYVEAAALYLRSATAIGVHAMDPWAQTSRYQAAQTLAKAGLVADARTLYEQLLAATDDPSRRAVLQRDLQQLLLLKQ